MNFFRIKHMLRKISINFFKFLAMGQAHPIRACAQRALNESVDYIVTKMPNAVAFETRKDLIDFALEQAAISGCYLEFGVGSGGTIQYMAKKKPMLIFQGFDSFEGLPESWAGSTFAKEAFSLHGKLPKVPKNVILHKGMFNQVLPKWCAENQDNIAFMHIDCDIYSSTVDILTHCADRIQPGTIILFDEYFNHLRWKLHEFKAWQEFVSKYDVVYEYIGFAELQVAIRVQSGLNYACSNGKQITS